MVPGTVGSAAGLQSCAPAVALILTHLLLSRCCCHQTSPAALCCARARLADGQSVLELGCGWGSMSLFMAQAFPNSSITAVSNSSTQREFIQRRARDLDVTNLTVITADMVDFQVGCLRGSSSDSSSNAGVLHRCCAVRKIYVCIFHNLV